MSNPRILFDFQFARSVEMLKAKNPKGLLFPFWSFAQSLRAFSVRRAYRAAKSQQTKPIWLYSDRVDAAGDNAEVFFEYCAKKRPGLEHVFIISKDSPDAARLRKIGRVVEFKSLEHKLFFLLADKYFLSHPETPFINSFGSKKKCYEDLINVDLIFLQHGITKDDLSDWLGKDKMGFSLIVTAAQKEYDSFLDAPYGYTAKNLVKCGFPRYDKLENKPARKILIMPTWRQNLAGKENHQTDLRNYNPEFKDSEYCKFYNDLINDARILDAMKKAKISGEFYLHPALEAQTRDFASDGFTVMTPPYNYTRAFAEGNLLVTDYSSVAFDFAYLKKPVIYCQFDQKEVYGGNHISTKNYISFKTDGFGPVVTDYESTVREILNYIKNNFKNPEKYQKRADKFYFHHDRKNCQRLLEAVEAYAKR
jgi:CDP-glycerol glycerophosphotransferase (TagB/SpsB family)